jgi:hypothetical protein
MLAPNLGLYLFPSGLDGFSVFSIAVAVLPLVIQLIYVYGFGQWKRGMYRSNCHNTGEHS